MKGSGLFRQNGDGRQDTRHVAGQKNNAFWFPSAILRHPFGYVFQGIATTPVLGEAGVVVVGTALVVQDHIFHDGTKTDGIPDDRFIFLTEIDGLGVATAFDVKDGAFSPAVLVITNQIAGWVCRQCGFTGSRQTKEQSCMTILANIGGTMHGHHVFFRKQKVLHGKHGLLHFPGIAHACDQYLALSEIHYHGGV